MKFFSWALSTAIALVVRPREFFRKIRDECLLGFPLDFAALMGALTGMLNHFLGGPRAAFTLGDVEVEPILPLTILGGVLGIILGSVILALLIQLVSLLADGKPTWGSSFRIACLASIADPISSAVRCFAPLSSVALAYEVVLIVLGMVEMQDAKLGRAVAMAATIAGGYLTLTQGWSVLARR